MKMNASAEPSECDVSCDVGDAGCGDLAVELKARMSSLRPGQVLNVTARDPGAPEDIPAWCRLTGHGLLAARHPEYRIQKKEN
ncbi:MAG: sulfurtransferase TusA family protein [Planctomycetota bacterium]